MGAYTRRLTGWIGLLLIVGTSGYVLLENWPVIDSLYMTVITLSTVGYGEIGDLSDSGRVFTSLLISVSVVSMACWTASITSILVSDDITGRFKSRQEKKMIQQMKGHAVVCGGGLFAKTVVRELSKQGKSVVIVTEEPAEVNYFNQSYPDTPVVNADPKSEMALADANCFAAACIIAATDDDYDNLLITITGRGLGDQVKVISCAHTNELTSRMLKIGANEVICPLILGGEKAASFVA